MKEINLEKTKMKTKIKISKRAQEALDHTASTSLALRAVILFAAQNPGFEWGNYSTGDYKQSLANYRADSGPVTRDWQRICALLWQTRHVTDTDVEAAARSVYSGRLSVVQDGGSCRVEYCAGQYFPTEYRRAAFLTIERAIENAQDRITAKELFGEKG